MTVSLLPPNATPLQRSIEGAIAFDDRIRGIAAIAGAKLTIPDSLIPWLLWEYGLAELAPYLADPRSAIAEGLRWQRVRGTPASLSMALGWIGFDDARLEETGPGFGWSQVQIDPGRVPTRAEARNMIAVARLALPARSRLVRLYHEHDLRPARYDGPLDPFVLLDGWSGVDLDGVRQSYGVIDAVETHRPPRQTVCGDVIVAGWRRWRDGDRRLDVDSWEGPLGPTVRPCGTVEVARAAIADRRVAQPTAYGWGLPRAVAAHGRWFGDVNTVFDGAVEWRIAEEDARLDTARFDASEPARPIGIERIVLVEHALATSAAPPRLDAAAATVSAAMLPVPDAVHYDQPAPEGRRGRASVIEITGMAATRVGDGPWGDGPWGDGPWGDALPGIILMEEYP